MPIGSQRESRSSSQARSSSQTLKSSQPRSSSRTEQRSAKETSIFNTVFPFNIESQHRKPLEPNVKKDAEKIARDADKHGKLQDEFFKVLTHDPSTELFKLLPNAHIEPLE